MKKHTKGFVSAVLMSLVLQAPSFAECDWSTIKPATDGTFIYSRACHLHVGQIIQDEKFRIQQVEKLNKAIQLQDLAIDSAEKRIELWKQTSYKLEDRLLKADRYSQYTDLAYFSAGVLTMIGSAWIYNKFNH